MRIEIGYKFIWGFILVVAVAGLLPYGVNYLGVPEWIQGVVTLTAAMTVGLFTGRLFSKKLAKTIGALLTATTNIANGDLRHVVDLGKRSTTDEFDDLSASINKMLANLRQMVAHILNSSAAVASSAQNLSATAEEINASSEEISVTTDEVAKGVEHQKAGVEKMADLFRELDRGFEDIAASCKEAAASAREAETKAQNGSKSAQDTFGRLQKVLEGLEQSVAVFKAFSNKIQKIHKFAEVITNLSRQTNLLALNAAIEASKAGDEGKGFAVVASEIRKLADNAENSADQITSMLSELDEESRNVRELVEASSLQVADGRQGLAAAGSTLDEITSLIAENTKRMDEILRRTKEQTSGSRKLTEFVDQIERVAESNAAATHEVSVTIEHQTAAMEDMSRSAIRLSTMAEDMNEQVERFQLPEEENN